MNKKENEILKEAQSGDNECQNKILVKYKPLVSAIANKYFLVGGDKEDLIQEGWIGLFFAIKNFDFEKNDDFAKFASVVIMRRIVSSIRKANANKNQVLDNSFFVENDEMMAGGETPEDSIISSEIIKEINEDLESILTQNEKKIVDYFIQGFSYKDIASKLSIKPKTVDNTLYKVKKKLKHFKEKL